MARRRVRTWRDVDKGSIELSELLRLFLLDQADRNHSPRTIRWYEDLLGRFVRFLGEGALLRELTVAAVRAYQRDARESGVSRYTLHAYARTVKTFLRWLERREYLNEPLSPDVQMPKVPRYDELAIDVLTDEEIARLLSSLDDRTDVGVRDRAIVCLMLECGLRLEEVVKLALPDLHLRELYFKVHGKGGKEQYVPLGATTQRALQRYIEHFRVPACEGEVAVFLNIYGEPLGYEAVKSIFDRLARRSGIERLHPHLLRHTAATRMLANGADVHSVQRILRHADIRTTLRYLHLSPDELLQGMRSFSPLSRNLANRNAGNSLRAHTKPRRLSGPRV